MVSMKKLLLIFVLLLSACSNKSNENIKIIEEHLKVIETLKSYNIDMQLNIGDKESVAYKGDVITNPLTLNIRLKVKESENSVSDLPFILVNDFVYTHIDNIWLKSAVTKNDNKLALDSFQETRINLGYKLLELLKNDVKVSLENDVYTITYQGDFKNIKNSSNVKLPFDLGTVKNAKYEYKLLKANYYPISSELVFEDSEGVITSKIKYAKVNENIEIKLSKDAENAKQY